MTYRINKQDGLIVALLLAVTLMAIYFYVNVQARNQVLQSFYPIKARLALTHIACSPESPTWLRDILIEKTLHQDAPANQIAYISSQGKLYHCESGYTDTPLLSPVLSADTRFRYASVTKLWTADAILDLIKNNRITLDTTISQALPQINNPVDKRVNQITIDNLLRHQAGFDRMNIQGYDMFGIGEPICPDHLDRLNRIKLNYTPATMTRYSNLGYCLLGSVIEQTQGMPFSDYLKQSYHLPESNIQFLPNHRLPDEVAYNHIESGLTGAADIYSAFDYTQLGAVAGLSGSATALAQQVAKMAAKPAPNILSDNPNHACPTDGQQECFGYAMRIYQPQPNGKKLYFKDGDLLGVTTLAVISEDKGVVVVLSSGRASGSQKLHILETMLNNLP